MTTQAELDADLLTVLDQHLTTRRELLKRVRSELAALSCQTDGGNWVVLWSDVMSLMDRLLVEAKLPGSK